VEKRTKLGFGCDRLGDGTVMIQLLND